jgi:hypothetical protein
LWPWLIGLALLLFALWGVAWILDPEAELEDPARLSTEGVDAPDPVIVPAPANQ